MTELSEIQSFYKGKTIFITGASGFMGKVLVEKLLYSCSELSTIYVLMRAKRGRSTELRIDDMFKLPMFHRIRQEKPEMIKRVVPVQGDVTLDNLGLSDEERATLIAETNITFHCAATLRFEAKLRDAIELNTVGTSRVLELVKQMKKLSAFVHLSTAFCHVDQEELGERIYDSPDDPKDVIRLTQWLDEEAIDLITPKLIEPHPNTYTYSKRLAEELVAAEFPSVPCCIARPSIVVPAYKEPLPGWVDSLNGPVGIVIGAGKGVIRSMYCNANYHAEVIPVDFAINGLISIAHRTGTTTQKAMKIPVYNITQSGVLPITWGQVLQKGKKIAYTYPFEGQVWYPDGDIRSSKFIHNMMVFFFHIIPAYLIDFLMLVFRQKRFMVRLQKRITDGMHALEYFTTREWVFHNTNMLIMWGDMSAEDKKIFPINFYQFDVEEFLKQVILGARQYCMKEHLDSLPRARAHQRLMYVIHLTAVYLFYFGVLYFIYKHFETARYCLDTVSEKMTSLPVVGRLVDRAHL